MPGASVPSADDYDEEGRSMDSERFDGLVRSFGQSRSRRQTLRGLARAGALVALLAAKPVAAGKAGKSNPPQKAPKKPGNCQPGSGQNGQLGSSQPGTGQTGQNGSPGPSCEDQCFDAGPEPCGLACALNRECSEACVDACLRACPLA